MTRIDLENNFFDRRSVLELLKRRVMDLKDGYRQNLCFLGERWIGKTAIVKKFLSDLDDDAIVAVYLDLEHRDIHLMVENLATSLLFQFSKAKGLHLHHDLNLLLESVKKVLPRTTEEIKKIQINLAKGKIAEAYKDLINLPDTFTQETGKFCLVILDEFHYLEEFGLADVFKELGKRIMTQKKCLYLVLSSAPATAKKILDEKLSLLFGNFETLEIGPFDPKASQEFIFSNLSSLKISEELCHFLIDFTGGYPFYLSIICQELIQLAAIHKQSEVYVPLLTHAIENTIFDRWGVLNRHFELLLEHFSGSKGNGGFCRILISLSNGKGKIDDIASDVKLNKSIAAQKINRLLDLGLIAKNGNHYHFSNKLFCYWIKYIFEQRLKSVIGQSEDSRSQFKKEIHESVDKFKTVRAKELPLRIVELLHCFDSGSLQLGGRKYKLPAFKEVKSLEIPADNQRKVHIFKAMSQEGTWFIVFKKDHFEESDINIFLEQSRKSPEKSFGKILISLSHVDDQIRLRALQEKMWIWNQHEVNALLNLYGKPYIVL